MKKLFNKVIASMLVVSGVFAMGCQEYGIDSQPDAAPAIYEDSMESYTMAATSASAVVFNISSNTPWRIERDAEWITATPSMSATSSLVSEVKISAADNTTYTPRTATLILTAPEADYTKTITVYQDSYGDMTVTESSTDVSADGEEVTFYITTNKAWEYRAVSNELVGAATLEGAAAGVVSAGDTDEVMTYIINIKVPANTGVKRTLKFAIHTATAVIERTVNQKGITLELADENEPVFDLNDETAELTFNVKANVSGWKAEVAEEYADWLEVVSWDSESASGGTVTVKIKEGTLNPYLYRTGIINLNYESATGTVSVHQPSQYFNFKWEKGTAAGSGRRYVDNGDNTVTFYPAGISGQNVVSALKSKLKLSKGYKWVCEFDTENMVFENSHIYFNISAAGDDASFSDAGGMTRGAITPDIVDSGINNNCFLHNSGTWTGNVDRWNFDGTTTNQTTRYTGGEFLTADDIKNLESFALEMTENGVRLVVNANGKEVSFLRDLEFTAEANREKFRTAYQTVELYAILGFFNPNSLDMTNERITIKKCYFTAIE